MKKSFSLIGKGLSAFFCLIGRIINSCFVFLEKVVCFLWNWVGKIILLVVKFFFWIWGAVLASILVGAIAFWLISLGIKAFDGTQFASLVATEMGADMMREVPGIDLSVTDIDFEIIEE